MPSLLAFALLLAPAAPFNALRPAPAAPALGGRFAAQPEAQLPAQARSSVALRAAGTQDDDAFLAEGVRTPLRVFGVGALWLGLIGYIAIGAPGKSEAAQALDSELLAKLVANPFDPSCPALFTVLFNWMGVWPAVYAALLLPGADDQKPVPAVPFLAASVAFGMFAISPYLALREYRGATNRAPASLGGKWFESKLNAAVLGAGAVGLAAWGATAGDFGANVAEFKQLFDTQLFVHATTCDFCCLSLLAVGLVREDVERRGADEKLAALALVPLFGPLAWLLVRPSLNEA